MSISDDIAKVLEMRPLLKIGVVTRDEIEQVCTIAPRLAAWAQRVMPLVEAAEEMKRLAEEVRKNPSNLRLPMDYLRARESLLALALNLEVPT